MARSKLSSPSIGNARPPRPPRLDQGPPGSVHEAAREDRGWSPGRGATRKTGNGKRAPKR
jgi:hypothetical protein